ncbi:hypothetical protein DSO57_1007555 [Entomophthora muscae]|uniref:Uncharacterized protein n=1 Tax=Entomophthora muscae TaxID=34485 RepID=A0ACC2RM72_9FUNG|nr:hypothetical protein DSO57_1007555 [Entomophthora muscae]
MLLLTRYGPFGSTMHNNAYLQLKQESLEPFGITVQDILTLERHVCVNYKESHYLNNGSIQGIPDSVIKHFENFVVQPSSHETTVAKYNAILQQLNISPAKFKVRKGELNDYENGMYDNNLVNSDHAQDVALEKISETDSHHPPLLSLPLTFILLISINPLF